MTRNITEIPANTVDILHFAVIQCMYLLTSVYVLRPPGSSARSASKARKSLSLSCGVTAVPTRIKQVPQGANSARAPAAKKSTRTRPANFRFGRPGLRIWLHITHSAWPSSPPQLRTAGQVWARQLPLGRCTVAPT